MPPNKQLIAQNQNKDADATLLKTVEIYPTEYVQIIQHWKVSHEYNLPNIDKK